MNEGKAKKVNANIIALNEKQTSFVDQDKRLKDLTAKVAAAEAKTTLLEKELADKKAETQEMY